MKKLFCILLSLLVLSGTAAAAPSEWAAAEIEAARASGSMAFPPAFEENWQGNTTRAEFAWMAVHLLLRTLSYSESDLRSYTDALSVKVASYKNDEAIFASNKTGPAGFVDTSDPYVLLAADIGIVEGRGDGVFDPGGFITRQEAALMLLRTYAAYTYALSFASDAGYADMAEIAPWAVLAVRFVTKNNIMQGVGNNCFAPTAYYTREQTVLTFLRMTHLDVWKTNPGLLATAWAAGQAQ